MDTAPHDMLAIFNKIMGDKVKVDTNKIFQEVC